MVGQAFLPASAGHSCPAESPRGVPLAEADKNVCPTKHLRRDMSRMFDVRIKNSDIEHSTLNIERLALSPALSQSTGRGSQRSRARDRSPAAQARTSSTIAT